MKYWIFITLLFSSCSLSFLQAQQATPPSDTLNTSQLQSAVDSLQQTLAEEEQKEKRMPVPRKAAFWSLALPGAGQIYNRSWWKVPLVYGAMGGMAYLVDFNTRQYNRLRTALDLKRQDEPHEFSNTNLDDEDALRSLRDGFDRDRQLSYIFTVVVYGLQAMEAFVDAHLQNFDVNDDLSFQLKPSFELDYSTGQPALGIGVSIPLNKISNKPLILHPDFESITR
ncbi:MAG: DUF5683 domain-containing protein [Bacteroidota bacterium]